MRGLAEILYALEKLPFAIGLDIHRVRLEIMTCSSIHWTTKQQLDIRVCIMMQEKCLILSECRKIFSHDGELLQPFHASLEVDGKYAMQR